MKVYLSILDCLFFTLYVITLMLSVNSGGGTSNTMGLFNGRVHVIISSSVTGYRRNCSRVGNCSVGSVPMGSVVFVSLIPRGRRRTGR